MFGKFSESDSRIEDHAFRADAGSHGPLRLIVEVAENLVDHVAFVDGDAFVVHDRDRDVAFHHRRQQCVVESPNRVEHISAGTNCGAKNVGFERVDGDRRAGRAFAHCPHDRNQAA